MRARTLVENKKPFPCAKCDFPRLVTNPFARASLPKRRPHTASRKKRKLSFPSTRRFHFFRLRFATDTRLVLSSLLFRAKHTQKVCRIVWNKITANATSSICRYARLPPCFSPPPALPRGGTGRGKENAKRLSFFVFVLRQLGELFGIFFFLYLH